MRARRIGNAGGNTTGWIRSARPAAHTGAWLAIVTADDDRKRDVRFTLKFMSTDFQVLIGPDENDGLGPWYFSLNNRRLWVLKQCQKEGLLDNARCSGMIAVRVRAPRSEAEKQRYSVGNCALEAKFTREGIEGGGGSKRKGRLKIEESSVLPHEKYGATESKNTPPSHPVGNEHTEDVAMQNTNDGEDNSDSDSDDGVSHENPFSALL